MDTIETLINGILLAVDNRLANLKVDTTKQGRVIEVLNNNKYIVTVQGKKYTVKSHIVHTVDDIVYILFPQKNYNDGIIIY